MPIIVPIEENHEGIAGLTDEKFRAADYGGSGLEALGKGLATLGDGGAQLATALDEKKRREQAAAAIAAAKLDEGHQRNLDDAAVKNAYVAYSDQSAERLYGKDGLLNQAGAKAHAAFPAALAALADAHDQALAPLDQIQREIVAPILEHRLRSDADVATSYVKQQGVAEQKWQSEQLQKAAARDAVLNVDDPDLHDHHMETGKNAIRQQGKIDNVADKFVAGQIADFASGVHADTIEAVSAHDPARAADLYSRYVDRLKESDKRRVESTIVGALAGGEAVTDIGARHSAPSADAQGNEQARLPFQTSNTAPAVVPAGPGSTTQESDGRSALTDTTSANETSQTGPDVVVRARVAGRQAKPPQRPVAPKAKPPASAPVPAKPERGAEVAAQWAYDQKGSTEYREYGLDRRVGGTRSWIAGYGAPKCNFFVYDALMKGGIPQTSVNGQRRIALAGDWGNRNSDIPGFRPLRVDADGHRLEPVMKGDIVSNGGHVGMVVGVPYKGRAQYIVASAADPDHDDMVTLTEFGFRPIDNPRNEKFKIVIWRHVRR